MARIISYLLWIFLPTCALHQAITYELNKGRLGDNISTYLKAQYCSYITGICLLYKPFTYSDSFALHTMHESHETIDPNNFHHHLKINKLDELFAHKEKDNTLFIIHFYTELPSLYDLKILDQQWKLIIDTLFVPQAPITMPQAHDDEVTVALHIRVGGGFDQPLYSLQWYTGHESSLIYQKKEIEKALPYADQKWPTKFPPLQYYFDQLKKLRELVPITKKLLVYLCTDDPQPAKLAHDFKTRLNDQTIQFVYREHDNAHDKNVVEDLICMSKCDCLIRSSSLFSKAAQILGNHKIIFAPLHSLWDTNKLIIDQVLIIQRN